MNVSASVKMTAQSAYDLLIIITPFKHDFLFTFGILHCPEVILIEEGLHVRVGIGSRFIVCASVISISSAQRSYCPYFAVLLTLSQSPFQALRRAPVPSHRIARLSC